MEIEQTSLRGSVAQAIEVLSQPDLKAGLIPSALIVTQITRYLADRAPSLRRVTDQDIVRTVQKGIILEGSKPPLPLKVSVEEVARKQRGRFRIVFKSPADSLDPSIRELEDKIENNESSPTSSLNNVLMRESLFPGQNLDIFLDKAKKKSQKGEPIKFGCFVCLPIQWIVQDGKPVYEVTTDRLSRLESEDFQFRTLELLTILEEAANIPFLWDFLIADTDTLEVFGPWLRPNLNLEGSILDFKKRIDKNLAELSHLKTRTLFWSQVQQGYQQTYQNDFLRASRLPFVDDDIQKRFGGRLNFYREYFEKMGRVPNRKLLEPLCLEIPRRNIALYAAQGPILKNEYDCLIIADRDPQRLGRYHLLLEPLLSIWYPYQGG